MNLLISSKIKEKLNVKHRVSEKEISQCFANRDGSYLIDNRADHQTDPVTRWFIAETNNGRLLKVVFVLTEAKEVSIKTAYEPNEDEKRIYENKKR